MKYLGTLSLALIIYLSSFQLSAQKFTIIAIPDTQHYTDVPENEANFAAQTQWIVENKDNLNIVFVTGLGDITQNGNNDSEWQIADSAYSLIENPSTTNLLDGIPYGLSLGNHDMFPIGGGNTANTDKFNQYFGESRFFGRQYYGGHHGSNNDNSYQMFSASGIDFIIIHFEYDTSPEQEVLDWADALLKQHSNRRAIITTHHMIGNGNPASFGTQGQAIFDNLKDNPNLFLMLGGHKVSEGRRDDVGTNGNAITTLLSDYQGRPNGGDGWLRMMQFDPENNTILVTTYSPVTNQTGADTNMGGSTTSAPFTLNYNMSLPWFSNTISFQEGSEGYTGTNDTYIFDSNPSTVRGAESTIVQDNESNGDTTRTSLLKFDISTIPSGSTINSANLEFHVDVEGKGFNMHKMLKPWDEATISFTSNRGHLKPNNVDAKNVIDVSWPGDNGFVGPISLNVSPITIQDWLDGNLSNNGWLLIATDAEGDGQQLASKESTTQANRPKLIVTYNLPGPQPSTLELQNGFNSYPGAMDTYIWDAEVNIDHGGDQTIVQDINAVDERRTLLKFDLSSIPDSSRIVSAKIDFNVEVEGQGFSMYQMLKSWDSSDTYNSIGGAHFQADDVDAMCNSDAYWPGNDTYTGPISIPIPVSTIQQWRDGVNINNGWLMNADHPSDGQQLASSENTTQNSRPKLVIQYEACPLTTTFSSSGWTNGVPCITTDAYMEHDYDTSVLGSIDAAKVIVASGVNVFVADEDHVKAWRDL